MFEGFFDPLYRKKGTKEEGQLNTNDLCVVTLVKFVVINTTYCAHHTLVPLFTVKMIRKGELMQKKAI